MSFKPIFNFISKILLINIFCLIMFVISSTSALASENNLVHPVLPVNFVDETTEIVSNIVMKDEEIEIDYDIEKVSYNDFLTYIDKGLITTVYMEPSTSTIKEKVVYFEINEIFYFTDDPLYENFRKDLLEKGITIKNSSLLITKEVAKENAASVRSTIIFFTVVFGIIGLSIIASRLNREKDSGTLFKKKKVKAGQGKIDAKNFSNENTQDENITFDNVIGLHEVKKDMLSLVDFITNKDKYVAAGAELPKGVILYGPPGTGKTLLARAVANTANVPFYYMSGSDFVELYVGVGAKRVREFFEKAKKNAPAILFIDEIDAIGGKRGQDNENGEDRKTINALLTEMDGFTECDNIIVIATTNLLDNLDPALTRAGRFTNKYCVPLPASTEERIEIIEFYAKNKKFSEDVDLKELAKQTIGCSPADIKSILNEAAIISVQEDNRYITKSILDKAIMKNILNGHIKESQTGRDKKELKLVAYHEAGHALVGKLFKKDVTKVTILSTTNGAGGVTFTIPDKQGLMSIEELKQEVCQLYAGRLAEYLLFNDYEKVTTGASNDIDRATEIIRQIVSDYGMNDTYGLLNLNRLKIDPKVLLNEEVKLSKELSDKTLELLKKNKRKLDKIANLLLEKETIYEKDLNEIMQNKN